MLGGFLLSITLPIHLNFIAFSIPGLIAAIELSFVPEKQAYDHHQENVNLKERVKIAK